MHAPVLKRANMPQIIGLALVLGLTASLSLNVAMLTRSNSDAGQPSAVHLESIGPEQGRFFEARMDQRDAAQMQASLGVAEPAWGQSVGDRSEQIAEIRAASERAAKLVVWGRFLEERNARNDAAR